jgi:hypothetical protein
MSCLSCKERGEALKRASIAVAQGDLERAKAELKLIRDGMQEKLKNMMSRSRFSGHNIS